MNERRYDRNAESKMMSPMRRRPTRKFHLSLLTLGLVATSCAILFSSSESRAGIYNRVMQAFYMITGYQGTGADGALVVDGIPNGPTNPLYTDNTRTYINSASAAGQNVVNVASTAGFGAGQEVLIIQMIGTGAGQYETATINSVGGSTLVLNTNLKYSYTAYSAGTQSAQVIRVPQYSTVTINSGGYLTAHAFNGQTGGVVFFRSSAGVTVNYNATLSGQISVSGKGFSGGSTSSAGSGPGAGAAGAGATSLSSSDPRHLRIGAGGGGGAGGAGGAGGGILAIQTNGTITNNGVISANGGNAPGSGGGGGAGGSLWLVANVLTTSGSCGSMQVNGGSGNGSGTAGGAGQFIMFYKSTMACKTGAPAANSSYLIYKDK